MYVCICVCVFWGEDTEEDQQYQNKKYRKGQNQESKEARRARTKAAKQAKFDPNRAETTLQTKERKAREEQEEEAKLLLMESSDNDNDDNDEDFPFPQDHSEEEEETKEDTPAKIEPSSNHSRIEALRTKLHAKIAEKRAIRPEEEKPNSSVVSKRAARRADKKRRLEAKKKKQQQSTNSNNSKQEKRSMGGTQFNSIHNNSNTSEDLLGIDYGGLAGLKNVPFFQDNKSLNHNGNGASQKRKKKSLETLLALAQRKKQRLQELKAGTDADKEKAKNIQWGDTLKAATGEKVNDDTTILKKAIKRKVKKKVKSQEAWKARMEQVKDKMDERQQIRVHNISQRKLGGVIGANLSKKRIVEEEKDEETKKRPRRGPHSSRAGFEGKKQDFINGKNNHNNKPTKSIQ